MTKIHAAVCAMLSDVEEIKKTRDNKQQGYKFRGIDDVYNAVHPLLAKHKVFPACEIAEQKTSERETKAGGTLFCVHLKAKYTFFADDGSSIATEALGEGMDSADKASNKAMSSAYKYALFQLLCIPTEAVDSEEDSYEVKPEKRQADRIAAEHGMTTGDKVPKPPYPTALAAIDRLDSVDKAVKLAEWCEKEHVARRLEAKQHDELARKIADKLPEICECEADYLDADKLLLSFISRMRISDPEGTTLRIRLSDAKDAKLGAAA